MKYTVRTTTLDFIDTLKFRGLAKCSWWSWKSWRPSKIPTDKGNICAPSASSSRTTKTDVLKLCLGTRPRMLQHLLLGSFHSWDNGLCYHQRSGSPTKSNVISTFQRCPSWNLTSVRIQESGTRVGQSENMWPSTFHRSFHIFTLPLPRILMKENHNCPGVLF